MQILGCLLMMVVTIVIFVLVAGLKLVQALFGIKGNPFTLFRTVKNVHQTMHNARQEQASQRKNGEFYNETSQQRTDTTSPGARKIIPDDEGEYVSYEEIKDK